jgi:hypothetical protein
MTTNGTDDSEINLHSYSHLIFDKGAYNIVTAHWRKNSLFKNGVRKTGYLHVED